MGFTIQAVEEDRNGTNTLIVVGVDDTGKTIAARMDASVFDAKDDAPAKAAMADALDSKAKQIAADEAREALMAARLAKAAAYAGQVVELAPGIIVDGKV